MTRLLQRLAHSNFDELRGRCAERTRTAGEAVQYVAGRKWRREQLRGRLIAGSHALERAIKAIGRRDWEAADAALRDHLLNRAPAFVLNPAARAAIAGKIRQQFPDAEQSAVRRAAPLLEARYDLLGFTGLSFARCGAPVDWQFDPVHDRVAPAAFWARVPYLDPACGDHKIIWELNRHQHWLALGRAAWLTGEVRYASAFWTELDSWLQANPPLTGINWSSMLELAFRSISWIWALHFFLSFEDAGRHGWIVDLLVAMERQLAHVARHLSLYFSPNTHLLGEALALYVGGRVFPEFRAAAHWEQLGREVLLRESRVQVNPEGSHAEQSAHYHRYALDFYLLALAIARKTGDQAADDFRDVVFRMASFCRALADSAGRLPTIGDDDGGLLFPLCGRRPADVRDSLALAADLLRRPELAVGDSPEEVFWMLGGDTSACTRPCADESSRRTPASQYFADSGYAVLNGRDTHTLLDAGPHGFLNAGHAHADALSVVLTVADHPLLIDPGTASYTDRLVRDRFRSSAMHNTVVVNGRSQAAPSGPFHWQSRANGRLELWRPGCGIPCWNPTLNTDACSSDAFAMAPDYVEAVHDGYSPAVHRRGLLRMPDHLWLVIDHVHSRDPHDVDVYWHFDPDWRVDRAIGSLAVLVHRDGLRAGVASTARHRQEILGDEAGLGWYAPRYGKVVPSLTLRYSESGGAATSLFTAIGIANNHRLHVEPVPVIDGGTDGWHSAAALVDHNESSLLALVTIPPLADGNARCSATRRRVVLADGELCTDARLCVIRLAGSGEPVSLTLIEASIASWTGPYPFEVPARLPARDLHMDTAALRSLRSGSEARPLT